MEVFTYGGGTYLVDIFNAVAALAGSGAMESLMRLALALGLVFILVHYVFSTDFLIILRWYLSALLIYGILFVPKLDVQITDRLNPTLPAATVANVPFGLAYFAGLSSQVGDYLTRETETAYSLPGDLLYSANGVIFGARLLEMTTSFQITNTEMAANVSTYVQQCVFYGLLLGHLDLEEMKSTPDIWSYLTVQNSPSEARSFAYREGSTESIITCLDGATRLSALWNAELNRAAEIYGARIYSDRLPSLARAAILSDLPIAHEYLVGSSRDALGLIQQAMLINAINRSALQFSGDTGSTSALEIYAQARAESQATSTFRAVARQAEKWVPLLRIVLETLYYGLFPFLFPLLLLPIIGRKFFTAYFGVFIWLQSWGPAYVILHRIMMGEAAEATKAAALMEGGVRGVSLVTMSGIDAVNSDVALLAGFFLIMIPFLTAGLARGAAAIGGMSQSILAPVQSAATAAGSEAATGNISLGNTSIDTHRYNQTSAHSLTTSPHMDTGVFSYRTPEGATVSITPDGRQVVQGGGAASNFPSNINYGHSVSEALSSRAAASREQGTSLQSQSRESFATVNQQIADLAQGVNEGRSVSEQTGFSTDARVSENVSKLNEHARTFARQNNTTTQTALSAFAKAAAGVKVSTPGVVDLFSPVDATLSVEGGLSADARASAAEQYTDAQNYSERNNLSSLFDETRSAILGQTSAQTGGETSQFRSVLAQNYNQAKSFDQSSSRSFSQAERFEDAIVSQQRDSADFNQRLDQSFFEYLSDARSETGTPFGPSEARRLLVSQNADDQAVVRAHMGDFVDSYVDQNFGAVNAPDISEPSATSVNVGREENIAGVQATFDAGREAIESEAPEPDISGKTSSIKSSNTNVRENTSHALSERKDERDATAPQKEEISKEAGKGVFEKTFTTSPDDLEAWTKAQSGSENQSDDRSNPGGERENPVQNRRRRDHSTLPKSDDD